MKSEKLINAYNATSTIDKSTGDIETVEAWLERQLLNRIEKEDQKFNATHLWNKAAKFDSIWKCQSYWHALKDLETEGVIELDEDKEVQTINL